MFLEWQKSDVNLSSEKVTIFSRWFVNYVPVPTVRIVSNESKLNSALSKLLEDAKLILFCRRSILRSACESDEALAASLFRIDVRMIGNSLIDVDANLLLVFSRCSADENGLYPFKLAGVVAEPMLYLLLSVFVDFCRDVCPMTDVVFVKVIFLAVEGVKEGELRFILRLSNRSEVRDELNDLVEAMSKIW